MRLKRFQAFAMALLSALGAAANGQTITGEISINGGGYSALTGSPFTSGAAISVNVGSMTQDTTLRFYNATAAADLGVVTVSGTLGNSSKLLSIIVANGQAAFPTDPSLPLTEGVDDVAGIVVSDGDLRANTRVAVAATGDLTGSINVGHVRRLQFAVSGGEILGAVTATAANLDLVTNNVSGNLDPMAYVYAK